MKNHTKVFLFTTLDTWRSKIQYIYINLLHLIFNKASEYFAEINENKYSTLVPTNKCKEKKYEKLWIKSDI